MTETCDLGSSRATGRDHKPCSSIATSPQRSSPVLYVLLVVAVYGFSIASAGVCSGCYNGGQLFLPNNIFGPCRCLCSGRYSGPQCEFVGKRSAGSALPPAVDMLADSRLESKLNMLKDMWWRLKDKLNTESALPGADNNDDVDDNDNLAVQHAEKRPDPKLSARIRALHEWLE